MNTRNLQLYITTESPCSYFDDRMSSNLVPDPEVSLNMPIYNQLIEHGFRRSGKHSYRPHCRATGNSPSCSRCTACRIPVETFVASRSQQRCFNKNRDIELSVVTAGFSAEHFELYREYLNSRHTDGSMANPTEEDFQQFLYCNWSDTRFLELRLDGNLVAVAVTDFVSDGLSAVYSYFDPQLDKRSLGTYCILKQIEYAKQKELEFVYLGYWIKNHPKMQYKANFKPLQFYLDEQWKTNAGI
jgi:arginine-tRNA-protein transferase